MDNRVRRNIRRGIVREALAEEGTLLKDASALIAEMLSRFEHRPIGKLRRSVRRELARQGTTVAEKGNGVPNLAAGQVSGEQEQHGATNATRTRKG
jgi:outer membrane lipopolysaccharide assembly protein LptE/RlpB